MISSTERTRISKFLSLVLRHAPEKAGLVLDRSGWVRIDDLIRGCAGAGISLTKADIEEVVRSSDKQRFAFDASHALIRANQGHSVPVDLGYRPVTPPDVLFHGTATRFLDSIFEKGLNKGERHHVHLSDNVVTASKVGVRHGKLAILQIAAAEMHQLGFQFFQSTNGVWLTDAVPAQFITLKPS